MGLIEKWRGISSAYGKIGEESITTLQGVIAVAMGKATEECASDLESACTPRPPKAEWFGAPVDADGKPTGKWDAWWIDSTRIDAVGIWLGCDVYVASSGRGYLHQGEVVIAPFDAITGCVPVSREGFPAPVGWHVVGGE